MTTTTKKKKSRTKKNQGGYQQFLRALDFVGMGLKTSSCRIDRSAYFRLRDKKKISRRRIITNYEVTDLTRDFFDVTATFRLVLEERETGASPLAIEVTYQTHFHGKPPINEGFARRFAGAEFPLLVWPFFRQYVHDTAGRMSIPPITVPLSTKS